MGDILKWVQFALHILPVIVQVIKAAEDAIGSGNGAAKKALVMACLPAQLAVIDRASISEMVDAAVGAMNQAGVLKKAA